MERGLLLEMVWTVFNLSQVLVIRAKGVVEDGDKTTDAMWKIGWFVTIKIAFKLS